MDEVLKETLVLLEGHKKEGHSSFDTFCRLIYKSQTGQNPAMSQPNPLEILEDKIKSKKETRTALELYELKSGMIRSHKRMHSNAPKAFEDMPPVIVINYKGKQFLIDGSHRINFWHKHNSSAEIQVNVHFIDA